MTHLYFEGLDVVDVDMSVSQSVNEVARLTELKKKKKKNIR